MKEYWPIIIEYLKDNEYLTVGEASNIGVGRHILAGYAKSGKLERVSRGIYTLANQLTDEFELLQKKNTRVIYSYGTALYFHGLSDRAPNIIHVTVPQGYNVSHIKTDFSNVIFHYVNRELFKIGIMTIKSPQGGTILVYDKERCICDIIRDKNNMDIQIYQSAIKGYFELKEKNLRKLIKYSKIFRVENEVRNLIEVLI